MEVYTMDEKTAWMDAFRAWLGTSGNTRSHKSSVSKALRKSLESIGEALHVGGGGSKGFKEDTLGTVKLGDTNEALQQAKKGFRSATKGVMKALHIKSLTGLGKSSASSANTTPVGGTSHSGLSGISPLGGAGSAARNLELDMRKPDSPVPPVKGVTGSDGKDSINGSTVTALAPPVSHYSSSSAQDTSVPSSASTYSTTATTTSTFSSANFINSPPMPDFAPMANTLRRLSTSLSQPNMQQSLSLVPPERTSKGILSTSSAAGVGGGRGGGGGITPTHSRNNSNGSVGWVGDGGGASAVAQNESNSSLESLAAGMSGSSAQTPLLDYAVTRSAAAVLRDLERLKLPIAHYRRQVSEWCE